MQSIRAIPLRVVFAVVLAAIAASASAQNAGHAQQKAAQLQQRFAAADKNGDGKLTKEEAQAGMPMVYKHFDEIDKGKQGAVTMADIAAFAAEKRAAKKGAAP